MQNFKELQIWKKAIDLGKKIYEISASFPSDEKFGITSQMRRCVVSISSNIAEGSGRRTDKDFSSFLSYSLGSQYELESQLIICQEIGLISEPSCNPIIDELKEIQKMTFGLIEKLSKS